MTIDLVRELMGLAWSMAHEHAAQGPFRGQKAEALESALRTALQREPLPDNAIENELSRTKWPTAAEMELFRAGVRFAERHYGIKDTNG